MTFTIVFIVCGASSTFHLVLIISERYFAIKHTFAHESIVVTKARLLIVSALVWILTIPPTIFPHKFVTVTMMGIAVSSIIVFHVLVYREARRHEQQILSHQVSEEARAKFKKEMKALKLTTIVIVVLVVSTFPTLIFTIVVFSLGENFSLNNKSAVRHLSNMPIILSSLLNPVVYTIRKEEFRIACIELLLRKSYQEATEISRRLFGPSNNAVGAEEREQGEGWERDAEERNSRQAYDSPESDPEALAPSAYLAGNNTAAPQSLNGREEQLQIIQEGEKRTENAEEKNPRQAIDGYEGNPKDLAPSGNLAGNSTAATQSLYCREEQTETLQHGEEGKENSQERNPPQANCDREDDPETLVPSANLAGNNTSSPQSLKGTVEQPDMIREDEERKESAKERNGRHVNDGHEDVSEALLSSSCLTGNTDIPSLRSVNGTVEQPEIIRGDEERKENAKERNRPQVNDGQEHIPEALLVSVHLTDNNTSFLRTRSFLKPLSDPEKQPQTTQKGKRQDQNVKERNPRQANLKQDNYPKVQASSAYLYI